MAKATRLDCGHAPSKHGQYDTGYGRDWKTGKQFCYDCCKAIDLGNMVKYGIVGGYVDLKQSAITSWPGGVLLGIEGTKEQKNAFGRWWPRKRTLTHVWARDAGGAQWYGKGAGDGMYITMRRLKHGEKIRSLRGVKAKQVAAGTWKEDNTPYTSPNVYDMEVAA